MAYILHIYVDMHLNMPYVSWAEQEMYVGEIMTHVSCSFSRSDYCILIAIVYIYNTIVTRYGKSLPCHIRMPVLANVQPIKIVIFVWCYIFVSVYVFLY